MLPGEGLSFARGVAVGAILGGMAVMWFAFIGFSAREDAWRCVAYSPVNGECVTQVRR